MTLYARQISPSEQTSPFWDSAETWDGILLYEPVRKYAVDPHYKSILEVLQNYFDVSQDIADSRCSEYDSIAEYINDVSPRQDNKPYTEEQLTGWEDAAKSYNFPKADGYNPYSRIYDEMWGICKALSLVLGEEYDWKEIHGCCQGEYNRVIYPESRFSEQDIRNFECEFFNLGTEWCVTDEKPDSPNEICGGCIYCHNTDIDSIRREIAECFECEPGNVHLYSYHEKTVCYFESEQDEEEFGMEMEGQGRHRVAPPERKIKWISTKTVLNTQKKTASLNGTAKV